MPPSDPGTPYKTDECGSAPSSPQKTFLYPRPRVTCGSVVVKPAQSRRVCTMRIWKVVSLLLILTMAGACSTPDAETITEETPADSNAPATADSAADKPKAE